MSIAEIIQLNSSWEIFFRVWPHWPQVHISLSIVCLHVNERSIPQYKPAASHTMYIEHSNCIMPQTHLIKIFLGVYPPPSPVYFHLDELTSFMRSHMILTTEELVRTLTSTWYAAFNIWKKSHSSYSVIHFIKMIIINSIIFVSTQVYHFI